MLTKTEIMDLNNTLSQTIAKAELIIQRQEEVLKKYEELKYAK